MKNKQIAEMLSPLIEKDNVASVAAFLSQITQGKRPLPSDWEPHLLSVVGLKNRTELRVIYPLMRFANKNDIYEIDLIVNEMGTVSVRQIPSAMYALKILNELGFKAEFKLRPKVS